MWDFPAYSRETCWNLPTEVLKMCLSVENNIAFGFSSPHRCSCNHIGIAKSHDLATQHTVMNKLKMKHMATISTMLWLKTSRRNYHASTVLITSVVWSSPHNCNNAPQPTLSLTKKNWHKTIAIQTKHENKVPSHQKQQNTLNPPCETWCCYIQQVLECARTSLKGNPLTGKMPLWKQ